RFEREALESADALERIAHLTLLRFALCGVRQLLHAAAAAHADVSAAGLDPARRRRLHALETGLGVARLDPCHAGLDDVSRQATVDEYDAALVTRQGLSPQRQVENGQL